MNKYAVINLKTDPKLKKAASEVAQELGISISAVLNNELRRLSVEKRVVFDVPEKPNTSTKKEMQQSKKDIEAGDYHSFETNKEALNFLVKKL